MADDVLSPMTPSGDHCEMTPYWAMVDAILGGAKTMRDGHVRHAMVQGPETKVVEVVGGTTPALTKVTWTESPYLPRFPNEGAADYENRRCHAPFTNIYGEVSDNLSGKPFAKECALDEKSGDDLKKLSENIDGQGHNLHVFAKDLFKAGLDKGVDWILIDYTKVAPGLTVAAEKAIGARPYWVRIPAERMLAVYSDFVNGQEIIYHARIYEPVKRQSGYGEECVEQVRVLNRVPVFDEVTKQVKGYESATWELYEKTFTTVDGKDQVSWDSVGTGPITIGIIPLVPFIPVGRVGSSWKVKPAFHDIAYMQVEEFQQESNLKTIKELTAFPMLSGNGVTIAKGDVVPVGPRAVLTAPMGADGNFGNWTFIEPDATSLTFLQTDLEKHRTEMRNLGRQPLSAANLTVVTTANVAMKAHSAVQGWALLLKDCLEQAWKITCMWLKQDKEPVVLVHTDFGVDFEAGTELDALDKARSGGVISKRLQFGEMKRRGTLSDDADFDADQQQVAEEQQGLEPEQAIDPVTGKVIEIDPLTGQPKQPVPVLQ